jgi:hypothetical protein
MKQVVAKECPYRYFTAGKKYDVGKHKIFDHLLTIIADNGIETVIARPGRGCSHLGGGQWEYVKEKSPAHCETVTEKFDNDVWLGEALDENLDPVRAMRNFMPDRKIHSCMSLTDIEVKLLANTAITLVNRLTDYFED